MTWDQLWQEAVMKMVKQLQDENFELRLENSELKSMPKETALGDANAITYEWGVVEKRKRKPRVKKK